ncbi:hypothetical protein M0208_10065 [Sphingomonas sp. SUN019]|jgi:hypothetical protein|uniref:hypothetical protein n=1 Tax=Sphingomonas sp. SUN019 TaxID=2937788 RepID=UPI00216443CB|nr:hypothetical protein [Sphingomonas sp. SUN019]UVO50845.1 hypothetical protein M0208_10065 [Sphingomonas sp. SUN019]
MNEHYGWIEMVFTGVVVLGFAGWQIISVNREIAADKIEAGRKKSEDAARHPVGEHRLDDR